MKNTALADIGIYPLHVCTLLFGVPSSVGARSLFLENGFEAMGNITLSYGDMLARRKEIIQRFDAAFKPLGVKVLPHYTEKHQSSGHLYLTRIPGITTEQRNEIITKMAERGVACNVHYKPLPMHTAYKKMGFDIADYPNAYARFANEITLPIHTRLTDEEVEYVIANYTDILKEYFGK